MDQRDRADSTEPTLAAEPTDHRQATDPVDPMLRIDPDEPPAFGASPFLVMPTSCQLLPPATMAAWNLRLPPSPRAPSWCRSQRPSRPSDGIARGSTAPP